MSHTVRIRKKDRKPGEVVIESPTALRATCLALGLGEPVQVKDHQMYGSRELVSGWMITPRKRGWYGSCVFNTETGEVSYDADARRALAELEQEYVKQTRQITLAAIQQQAAESGAVLQVTLMDEDQQPLEMLMTS